MFKREWLAIAWGIALVLSAAWGWQVDPDEDGLPGAAALGESGAGGGSVDVDDIIGVAFGGNAYTIDSSTGVGNLLGPTGFTGFNAMAHLADGRYVATSGSGLYPPDKKFNWRPVAPSLSKADSSRRGEQVEQAKPVHATRECAGGRAMSWRGASRIRPIWAAGRRILTLADRWASPHRPQQG